MTRHTGLWVDKEAETVMRHTWLTVAGALLAVSAFAGMVLAEDAKPAPVGEAQIAGAGAGVTLKGMLMGTRTCWRPGQPEEPDAPILFAFEGTPEIEATFKDIFKELIASNSIDYQQSKTIEEELHKRLKYYLAITAALTNIHWQASGNFGGTLFEVTGVLSEKDDRKYIAPIKITDKLPDGRTTFAFKYKYPQGFYAPDKPFKMPGKDPLILKVTDTLSLKCILLPPGDFMLRKPFWYVGRWHDEFPRHITLTKPFWLAEIPVTQEMWDAVMGAEDDFSTLKDPQRPARNMTCEEILKFLKVLSDKNKRTVRLPGDAEWEYAARVGTSNPQLPLKYKPQDSGKGKECLPVKSRQPNAWGIYDMISGSFELARDKTLLENRKEEVDPYLSPEAEEAAGKFHKHWGNPSVWFHEEIGSGPKANDTNWKRWTDADYTSHKFRVAVDATPEEIAAMEKAADK